MENSRQSFSQVLICDQGKLQTMDNPKPRTWQILKQWPRGCGKNQRIREKTKRYCQQMPQGGELDSPTSGLQHQFAIEVPICDLEPLQTLNAFRRDLGLGRSSNLISSAIYDYDPTTIAECYEKSITDGFPRWPRYFPLVQQTQASFVECFRTQINGSTTDCATSNCSSSYQYSIDTRPSTAQHSSDENSIDTCPDYATPEDQQHDSPKGA